MKAIYRAFRVKPPSRADDRSVELWFVRENTSRHLWTREAPGKRMQRPLVFEPIANF